MQPVVIVNCKAYEQGVGAGAKRVAEACKEFGAWIAVQPTDIRLCAQTGAKVFAQHVDDNSFGSHTGSVLCEAVKEAGAAGSLVNHSEKRLSTQEVFSRVARLKELGLTSVVCAESVERAQELVGCEPDFLALELPELIGGDVSIVSAEPDLVSSAVQVLGDNVLLGAGVSSGEDLKTALDQGAKGVLLASAIVKKTADPRGALKELYRLL